MGLVSVCRLRISYYADYTTLPDFSSQFPAENAYPIKFSYLRKFKALCYNFPMFFRNSQNKCMRRVCGDYWRTYRPG